MWASVLDGDEVVDLPESDQLPGTPIRVTDRRGDTWITTIKTVVSRSDTKIVVTTTGRAAHVRKGVSTVAGRVSLPALPAL